MYWPSISLWIFTMDFCGQILPITITKGYSESCLKMFIFILNCMRPSLYFFNLRFLLVPCCFKLSFMNYLASLLIFPTYCHDWFHGLGEGDSSCQSFAFWVNQVLVLTLEPHGWPVCSLPFPRGQKLLWKRGDSIPASWGTSALHNIPAATPVSTLHKSSQSSAVL